MGTLDQGADLAFDEPVSWMQRRERRDAPSLVREALAQGRTQLVFQPVLSATDPAVLLYHEATLWLLDGAGRVIPPSLYADLHEETELGRQLDCATLTLALDMLRAMPDLRLAINVSARSLADCTWRRALEGGPSTFADFAERLVLEIGECSAIQLPEVVSRFMTDIEPRGICCALDRFGGGVTAFRHLSRFLFDFAKIAPDVVSGIDTDPDRQVMAAALVAVARQFDMVLIADGVEREEEARILRAMGVEFLQGGLFARPRFMA